MANPAAVAMVGIKQDPLLWLTVWCINDLWTLLYRPVLLRGYVHEEKKSERLIAHSSL